MHSEKVIVRAVRGRHPRRAGKLESKNISASVFEEGARIRIRLDDADHDDFWLELVLDLVQQATAT